MKSDQSVTWRERIRNEMTHPGILLLDLGIAAACVVLICSLVAVVTEFYESRNWVYEAYSMFYRLEEGNYAELAEMTWNNRMSGKEDDADFQEYYAVADYYEAAVSYCMSRDAKNDEEAEKWQAKMADAVGRMGTFTAEKAKIDEMLGITEN